MFDHLNTVRDVAVFNGSPGDQADVVNHLTYNSAGSVVSADNPQTGTANEGDLPGLSGTGNEYSPQRSYTGREPDAVTGLIYYRARWYDPRLGRFISEDPIGFAAGDANLRRYVGNSMPNAVDPTGLIDPTVSLPWNPVPTHVRQHQNRVDNYGSVNGVSRALVSTATVGFKNDFDVVKPPDEIATDKSYTFTVFAMQGVTELGIGLGAGKLATAPGRLGKAAFAYDAVQNTSNFGQGVYRGNKLQAGLGVVGITGNVSGLASRARRLEDLTQAATVDARTVDAVTGPNNANAVDNLCVEAQADEGLEWLSAPNSGIQANKAAGDAVRDLIAAREAPALIEQSFTTVGGVRRVDVLKLGDELVGIESKVGRTALD